MTEKPSEQAGLDDKYLRGESIIVTDASADRPTPNWRYIYIIKKRLEWRRCEDRETVISLFSKMWPEVADRAEALYDMAEADPRSAAELLETYGFFMRQGGDVHGRP